MGVGESEIAFSLTPLCYQSFSVSFHKHIFCNVLPLHPCSSFSGLGQHSHLFFVSAFISLVSWYNKKTLHFYSSSPIQWLLFHCLIALEITLVLTDLQKTCDPLPSGSHAQLSPGHRPAIFLFLFPRNLGGHNPLLTLHLKVCFALFHSVLSIRDIYL